MSACMLAKQGLARAAEAVGLAVRPLAFGSPLADAAFAAHGPGSVRLPLAIVAGRYSLQRPAFAAVLECVEVLHGVRRTLPAACVVLAHPESLESSDDPSPDGRGFSTSAPNQKEADSR